MNIAQLATPLLMCVLLAACGQSQPPAGDTAAAPESAPATELVVYSERREPLIQPVFDRYREQTGVTVRYLTDSAPVLIERLAAEGADTPADIFLSVDAGSLWQASERGLLAELDSAEINRVIPANLRDPDDQWTALSLRARTIVYSTERVEPGSLESYESLADEKWRGRLCLRTSKKVYNQSLTATLIERLGAERTEQTLRGWVDNLAAEPFADDTALIMAIAAGQCDVGLVNTYYLGRAQAENPDLPVAVFWPNQSDAGVHVNISGAGIVAESDNQAEAKRFLEWLVSEPAQKLFAEVNFEFPARTGIEVHPLVAAWGEFVSDPVNVSVAGQRQAEAVQLMDRAGWR
jgi:iron(III) transport system substrate-binding protein